VSFTGRDEEVTPERRAAQRYTLSHLAHDVKNQTGIGEPVRDWFPISFMGSFTDRADVTHGAEKEFGQLTCGCHPNCGVGMAIMIDKETKEAVPVTKFLKAEQLAKDIASVSDAGRGRFLSVFGMALALVRNYDSFNSPTHFKLTDLLRKFDKTFGATKSAEKGKYGKVEGDRTIDDIKKRRADRWNFLFIAGMWFQDLFNYDFRRTEMCIIPYATQQGEISLGCALAHLLAHGIRHHSVESVSSRPGRAPRSPRTASRNSELQLDAEDVALGRTGVLDGVDDGLVPGERPRLARVDLRGHAVRGHLGLPIREVDAHPVRVAVSRLDLAGREVDVEHAHELVLEGEPVSVACDAHRIERVVRGLGQDETAGQDGGSAGRREQRLLPHSVSSGRRRTSMRPNCRRWWQPCLKCVRDHPSTPIGPKIGCVCLVSGRVRACSMKRSTSS